MERINQWRRLSVCEDRATTDGTRGVFPRPDKARPSPRDGAEKANRAATSLIIPALIGPMHLEPRTPSRHHLIVQRIEGRALSDNLHNLPTPRYTHNPAQVVLEPTSPIT